MKRTITTKQISDWVLVTARETAWAPIGVFVLYFIGLLLGFYDRYPFMDIPTHFLGGVVITYFYRSAIHHAQKFTGDIPLSIQIILAFTSTGTTTVLWEFYENISDYFFATHHVFGLADTLRDLLMGLLGALVLSLFYRRR